jgi:hypothetical protein
MTEQAKVYIWPDAIPSVKEKGRIAVPAYVKRIKGTVPATLLRHSNRHERVWTHTEVLALLEEIQGSVSTLC